MIEPAGPRLSGMRFLVLAATALVASNMYLDRVCLAQVADLIHVDLKLADWQKDWALSAFFWAYALAQVPAGALGARIGYRHALAIDLVLWSAFTMMTGLATGFLMLLAARLAVGLAEAGAYPSAAAIVRGWFPVAARGRASSVVALGGRLGLALAQLLTPTLVLALACTSLAGWRAVLLLFGGLGLVAAPIFWLVARDAPSPGPDAPRPPRQRGVPWRRLIFNRNLALYGATQFGINIGWAFLITHLPTFLTEARHVPLDERGPLAALPAWASCVGLLLGGFVTDALTRRLGPRLGRALPIGCMLFFCAGAYLACVYLQRPWLVVAALALMGLGVDLTNPSIWAFAQDVGGRHAAVALGWGNMWGNFGAALSPVLLGVVQREFGWDAVFVVCAIAFSLAGTAGLFLDATRPLED